MTSHLDLQRLPSSPLIFQFELEVFGNFADVILLSAFFLALLYEFNTQDVCCFHSEENTFLIII